MDFRMNTEAFDKMLNQLSRKYDILGPVRQKGAGRHSDTDVIGYGSVTCLEDLVLNEKSFFSPKESVLPIRETLFYFSKNQTQESSSPEKDVLIFLRPCDLNGIERLDTIFMSNGPYEDPYYRRRRENVRFFMLECSTGFESCFCVSMDANKSEAYDLALKFEAEEVWIKANTSDFDPYLNEFGKSTAFELKFVETNTTTVSIPPVEGVTLDLFDHEVWKEYTQRCIHCGRCNTSCPTCSCFTMQDVLYDANGQLGERRRRWAGCHVDGFTDMAGGHGFRKKDGERMRFKTLHKINDFYRRFGKHMCVGCGRCDDVCPELISFSKCINKLSVLVEERAHE